MRKLIFFFFLSAIFCEASGQNWQWVRSFADSTIDNTYDHLLVTDSVGNTYVSFIFGGEITVGDTNFGTLGHWDICLAKYDIQGNFVWARHVGSTGYDWVQQLRMDNQGNVVMLLSLGAGNSSGWHFSVFTAGGSFVSFTALSISGCLGDIIMQYDAHGNSYVAGSICSPSFYLSGYLVTTPNCYQGCYVPFLAKMNKNYQVQWAFSVDQNCNSEFTDIKIDSDGSVVVGGQGSGWYGADSLAMGAFIVKYDTLGNVM